MEIREKIRTIRQDKGLTLKELYRRIKEQFGPRAIDYGTLKRIQAGKTKPTEFSLYRISMGLGVKLKELRGEKENVLLTFIPKDKPEGHYDYTPINAQADKLSTGRLTGILPQRLSLKPGAKTRIEKDPEPTPEIIYQKWVYGLRGEIVCIVGNERCVIRKGDTCFFESHNEHYFENTSAKTALCLVIQCPPYV